MFRDDFYYLVTELGYYDKFEIFKGLVRHDDIENIQYFTSRHFKPSNEQLVAGIDCVKLPITPRKIEIIELLKSMKTPDHDLPKTDSCLLLEYYAREQRLEMLQLGLLKTWGTTTLVPTLYVPDDVCHVCMSLTRYLSPFKCQKCTFRACCNCVMKCIVNKQYCCPQCRRIFM